MLSFNRKNSNLRKKVIHSGNEDHTKKVYFISAFGTQQSGSPTKETFMFDLYSKELELVNITTYSINSTNLIIYYDLHRPIFVTFFDVKEEIKYLQIRKI